MRKRNFNGFSLLEMIGVMAVMAILAGALAPSVFELIDEGYQTAERQSLATIGDALQRHIRQNKTIPTEAPSVWSTAVANFASLAPQRVLANDKNFSRRLFIDRMFFTGSNTVFPGYTQNQGLASPPVSPRAMLVSNLQGQVTQNLTTNAQFSDVWDQTADAIYVESKSLFVERINLAPLFVRVVLTNANTSQAGFTLEGGTQGAVAAASGGSDGSRTVYVIADTQLNLNAAPFPGGATLRQAIVANDMSLRYQLDGSNWQWVN